MNQEIENRLKKISIRGRMALALKCLEIVLDKNELLHKEVIKKLLFNYWEIVRTKCVVSWEDKIYNYNPEDIIESVEDDYEDDSVTKEEKELYDIYKHSKSEISEMVNCIIEIGTSDLYASSGEYSIHTLTAIIEVLKMMERNNYQIPELSKFEKSKFSEEGGWGFEREKSFFD